MKTRNMEYLNFDTNGLIFSFLPLSDKSRLFGLFGEKSPSQYEISKDLLKKKNLHGLKGLYTLAITTGEIEPCVQFISQATAQNLEILRSDYSSYDPGQRVDRVMNYRQLVNF